MSPAELEKTKLVANALDRISTACVTVGVATPLAGLYNIGGLRTTIGLIGLAVGLGGWIVAALTLHLAARRVLKGLDT